MPYQNIFNTEVPTEVQQQAIAAKLRGDDARATLALLSGDPTLTRVGNSIKTSNKEKAEGLRKTIDSIETRNAQAAEAEAKREFQGGEYQANRDQADRHHTEKLEADKERAFLESIANSNKAMMDAAKTKEEQDAVAQKLHIDYEEKRQERGYSSLGALAVQINEKLSKSGYFDEDWNLKKDIPAFSGSNRVIEGWGLKRAFSSEKAAEIHSLMSSFANMLLKARSGQAVTPHEYERLQEELSTRTGNNDQDLLNAFTNAMERFQSEANELATAYGYVEGDPVVGDQFQMNWNKKSKEGAGENTITDE